MIPLVCNKSGHCTTLPPPPPPHPLFASSHDNTGWFLEGWVFLLYNATSTIPAASLGSKREQIVAWLRISCEPSVSMLCMKCWSYCWLRPRVHKHNRFCVRWCATRGVVNVLWGSFHWLHDWSMLVTCRGARVTERIVVVCVCEVFRIVHGATRWRGRGWHHVQVPR